MGDATQGTPLILVFLKVIGPPVLFPLKRGKETFGGCRGSLLSSFVGLLMASAHLVHLTE